MQMRGPRLAVSLGDMEKSLPLTAAIVPLGSSCRAELSTDTLSFVKFTIHQSRGFRGDVVEVTSRRGYRIQKARDDLDRMRYEEWLTLITGASTSGDSEFTTEFRNMDDPYGRQAVSKSGIGRH